MDRGQNDGTKAQSLAFTTRARDGECVSAGNKGRREGGEEETPRFKVGKLRHADAEMALGGGVQMRCGRRGKCQAAQREEGVYRAR
jgi:hypothetical protein